MAKSTPYTYGDSLRDLVRDYMKSSRRTTRSISEVADYVLEKLPPTGRKTAMSDWRHFKGRVGNNMRSLARRGELRVVSVDPRYDGSPGAKNYTWAKNAAVRGRWLRQD
jgi:hypothetical protein